MMMGLFASAVREVFDVVIFDNAKVQNNLSKQKNELENDTSAGQRCSLVLPSEVLYYGCNIGALALYCTCMSGGRANEE